MADPDELYRELAPPVLGYLRGQRAAEPEDLLQEVFLQVARDLPKFRGSREQLRSWVFSVAHNRLLDSRRRAAVRPVKANSEVPDRGYVDPGHDPVDPALVAACNQLTADQREVVLLRFVADLSLQEVARITGRRTTAVKRLQARALERLGQLLG
jgi:RNA polymerase sigma factor (sigma-70 family)